MCSKLTDGELKNCTCKLAHLCKRRVKTEPGETQPAPLFTVNHFKINSLPAYHALAYTVNFLGSGSRYTENQ
jgi:hypothetical protein